MSTAPDHSLTVRILWGMGGGMLAGALFHALVTSQLLPQPLAEVLGNWVFAGLFDIGGAVFVASLKLLVVPLVLFSLILGVANLGADSAKMGRVAIKTLGLYMLTTAVAIALALAVASVVDPGKGMSLTTEASFEPAPPPGLKQVLINIFPTNPINAMAEGNMLQVIVFAVLFGFALTRLDAPGARLVQLFSDLDQAVMKLVVLLMWVAPYGVFCLLASLFASEGIAVLGDMARYVFTVLGVLLAHLVIGYGGMLLVVGRLNPWTFFTKMRPAMLFGFSTASSNATLPVTLNLVETRLGVNNSIAAFSVPLGATINMDGTAIMQGVATVFIAQAYGIEVGFAGYLMVVLTATLASVGTAGVPGVGLVTLAMVLTQAGLPVEGIALIIGVDRLLDMVRTAVNIAGDAAVSTVVARSEGELDVARFVDREAGQSAEF